ncbi:MAG: DUF115 domain-containing protein [Oscillospiraceae bacterium]|nr:DUF115 domain-containing protein [Oscillospiraceae bacterium]
MSAMIELRMMITRALGEDRWNRVLLGSGWRKFKKQNRVLSDFVQQNAKYKNIHAGKRCFIIGNGPSLKQQDLTLLKNEYVFTCNQIMRNPVYPAIHSNYHFFADPTFFSLKRDDAGDMEVYQLMQKINTDDNRPDVFFAAEGFDFAQEFELDKVLNLNYFAHRLAFTENYDLDFDFSKFLPNLHTVVHYAIALAIYMGFSEIYLLGCDCTNVVTAVNTRLNDGNGAEYAYAISENEKNRMQKRNASIHMEDELKSFSEVFRAYRIFGEYANRKNIKLVNCTVGGLLDCLPRMPYEEVLRNENETQE